MNLNILFPCLIIAIIFQTPCYAAQEELFKINKLNLIWTKAQHSLGSSKLKDLKGDLLKHESDELNLKKMKAHNQDKDGLLEAAVRKKLMSIMKKYSLERYFDDIHLASNTGNTGPKKTESNINDQQESKPNTKDPIIFRDSKLDKLWKKAEKSGFTQEQLMVLHEEFQHQQDKLDEHYETMNMLKDEIENRLQDSSRLENSIEGEIEKGGSKFKKAKKIKESSSDKKARLDENIDQALKEKNSDLKKNYEKLQSKIASGELDVDGPFEDRHVNELWLQAQKSKFSPEELESFKEELGHFETRIKKLKHFQNQLERNDIASASKESSTLDEEDTETKHIRKRVKELSHKVGKTLKSLEKKIASNQRTEL